MIKDKLDIKTSVPSRTGFQLPFEHNHVFVSQGYNGPYSHFAVKRIGRLQTIIQDDRYCLDFQLPLGTPVQAARSGIVESLTDVFSRYYEGLDIDKGRDIWTNFIVLRHDNIFTLYSHIAKGSAKVREGDGVSTGQIIAETGKSGWIGPVLHLHFAAYLEDHLNRYTFPVSFDDYYGPLEHSVIFGNTNKLQSPAAGSSVRKNGSDYFKSPT